MYKVPRYEGLVADLRNDGFMVRFCAVEVGARGLVSKSEYYALKQLWLKGTVRNTATRGLQ